jgi:outer membrane protein OmpA-like peptidoglycan-associated protein/tetratricopeptide (TPR) repeat protein
MSRGVCLLLILFLSPTIWAQDDCPLPDNKKAIKNWEQGIDRKKNKKAERIAYLQKAIEAEPEFPQALWAYAAISIKDARRKGRLPKSIEDELKLVVEKCPNLHSSPYFYLGELAFDKKNYGEAAMYYKQFLEFKSDDDDKFDRKHDELYLVAKEKQPLSAFFHEEFSNPKPFNPVMVRPVSSTESDEYLPLISPDNELMFFTRRDIIKKNPRATAVSSNVVDYEERFSSANLINGKLSSKGIPLPTPFNTNKKYNYGGACVSIKNDELFITICQNEAGKTNCDIFTSKKKYGLNPRTGKTEYYWDKLEPLSSAINTPTGWESQPTLSRDGKMLLFAKMQEGVTEGIDIYQSQRNPDGSWTNAKPVGAPINTPNHEKTPFFHSDSKTLYFSSKGHLNFGGYDVFKSKLLPDGTWTEPMNLGYPINTETDQHGYVVSTDGEKVYYASLEANGVKTEKVNIYQFQLYKEARPEKVVLLKGKIETTTGKIPNDAKIEVRNSKTDEIESFEVDSVDGSYTAIVTVEEKSDFVVSVTGKDVAFNNVEISGDDNSTYRKLDVPVQKAEVGKPYAIDNIQFKTNSAELLSRSKTTLEAFAAYLRSNPTVRVSIEGHTDNVGDPMTNLTLSTERAFSVMEYLQELGIHGKRLSFKGWGDKKPIAENSTEQGRAKNRRTEFVMLSK